LKLKHHFIIIQQFNQLEMNVVHSSEFTFWTSFLSKQPRGVCVTFGKHAQQLFFLKLSLKFLTLYK